ncbi:helix-turn-helix domain-containing protein [Cellulophaga lytica]|uniref:Transcriptional regulator, AraC family n=1 Tax=Cellulophaga lytica (strain ATCC 23178 / DSM 7489 / JCM 8516 / NBRC 14961 / NCIMB 1423 / VKM B-1433 / Cy l20) TaxID=867900 RepID=F0RIE3_CELLC|nr:helix-turn-helix domain-containing protein [Cellulophaga lytica]ADY29272.1 transcriptional regulator, AraC family [Cellulophaga lytica DSM 7489]AIM60309.1 hypothetical protein IX49_07145 [Cellulophaga lytica]APU10180.1 hypothetical protein A5M85_07755 [Cellulophaga lytica]WQG76553.1 helix-turn-helix transcriptional regulator [Cellulophaga lytica]
MKNIQEYTFKKEQEDFGINVWELDYFLANYDIQNRSIPHRLKFYAIVFITEGTGEHLIDFKTYSYKKNDMLFVGKNQTHAWLKQKNVKGYIAIFTQDFLNENQQTFKDLSYSYPYNSFLHSPKLTITNTNTHYTLVTVFALIYKEFSLSKTTVSKQIIQSLLRVAFLKIKTLSKQFNLEQNKSDISLFIQFQNQLDKNISITRNVNEYCKILNTTYRKLNDTCKVFTHKTAKSFIDDVIILKAKQYLSDQDKNISITSYLLGFEEVSNFSKFFKKHTSYTPKQFIASIKQN